MRVCIKEDNDEFPSVPPGFESFTSFSLKRVNESEKQDSENRISCSETASVSESQSVQMETNIATDEVAKRPLRRRPWINHRQHDNKPEDEFNSERLEQVVFQCSSEFLVFNNFICHFSMKSPILVHVVSYTIVLAEFCSKISSSQGGCTRMSPM